MADLPDPRPEVSPAGVRYFPEGGRTFVPGNTAALRHGAYAVVRLGPRVDELADHLRDAVPAFAASDEVALRLLSLALARIEATSVALPDASPADQQRLRADERAWANSARNLLADLGMTPASRVRLGLDLVRGTSMAAEVAAALDARERADARMSASTDDEGSP